MKRKTFQQKEEHEQRNSSMKEHTVIRKHEYNLLWPEYMVHRRLETKNEKGGSGGKQE